MGIRTRRARNNSKTHGVRTFFMGVLAIIALLIVALGISATTLMASWLEDLPDYTSADAYLAAEPTQIYDSKGNLIGNFYLENRKPVEMDAISPYVLQATVDVEDVRFYSHNGVDPQGIVRAVIAQLTGGSEGASTITQQLVRNTVLNEERFEYSLKRKVREAYIAIELEKIFTKDQILLMYLNTIYYGHGAYGVEVASITYFNKHAADLTLAEAALIAGLPQSPSYYDPTVNPEEAVARRNHVLDRMLAAGDITQEEHDAAVAEELQLNLGNAALDSQGVYPYWTDYIKQLLQEDFSTDTIFQGGLRVYTTIDPTYQQAAEEAVAEQLDEIGDPNLNAALVAIDPDTGYIMAMVGGRDYDSNQFNLATQARRQPGSSFKTFTLVAAINEGMNPTVNINCNSPLQVTPTWRVQNHWNTQYGTITLARAFEMSSNTGFAQVATTIGADRIVAMAHAMGIDEELPAYPSLTLGTVGVPPIQMAEAYATLATGGIHRDAVAITRIEDRNGNVVYEHKDNPTQAVDQKVAVAAIEVMKGVVTNGTATNVSGYRTFNQPVAGKTGTTENARDLWFVGFTPQVSVAVWTGYVQEAPVYIHGAEGTPNASSVMMWTRFCNKILSGVEREEFPTASAPTYKQNSSWTFSNTDASANNGALTPATTAATSADSPDTPATSQPASTTTPTPPPSPDPPSPDPPSPDPPSPDPPSTPDPPPDTGGGGEGEGGE